MTALLFLGLVAVFAGIVLSLSIVGTLTPERHTVERSLAAVDAITSAPEPMRRELDRPFGERFGDGMGQWLANLGRRLTPQGKVATLRRKLDLAGNPDGWAIDRLIALKALGLFVGGGAGLLLTLLVSGSLTRALLFGLGLAALGYFLPNLVVTNMAQKRSDTVRKKLPDALDLLTVSVEAGMGFDAALANVARNTEGPLAEEFFRVLQEMQLGSGRMDALRALSERTDVQDLQSFINAMIQADAFGIPIADVLRIQAKEMRLKRTQRAEEQAMKVPVKIMVPLVLCIMPALLIVVAGPAAINVMNNLLS
jgi:tight adherence protein C